VSDIVERLRTFYDAGLPVAEFVVVLEAADEIERLRTVAHGLMKILARPWIDGGVTWPEWDAAMKAAEDALNIKAADL
jgi:hypothetical protein